MKEHSAIRPKGPRGLKRARHAPGKGLPLGGFSRQPRLPDQLDPQTEIQHPCGLGKRIETEVVVLGVENPVQLAPARTHCPSHGALAHLPSLHGLRQLPGQNPLDRDGAGFLKGSLPGQVVLKGTADLSLFPGS